MRRKPFFKILFILFLCTGACYSVSACRDGYFEMFSIFCRHFGAFNSESYFPRTTLLYSQYWPWDTLGTHLESPPVLID